ncbi:uncharacterized protein LOC127103074 [Lathyrus oleraceus]|uniref:uncharacterized protein LOC127103074 n=1 Tax=Pisum sativum TaxID=3888 RepID=UPI0021D13BF8|nr:uncharacterized protein LOC127103074 [Pisum sativum]
MCMREVTPIVSESEKEEAVSVHSEDSEAISEPMAEAPPPVERLLGDYEGANAPTGRLTLMNQPMQNFVNGLRMKTKQLIDTVAVGSTNFTTATGIKKIIEAIAANDHLELYDHSVSQPEGIIDLKLANQVLKMEDQITAEVERRLKKMTLDTQTVAQVEEINFLKQNNPYSNTYNLGWKNHPNFSWKDQQGNAQKQAPTQYQSQPQQQYRPQQQQPYQQQFHQSQQQFQQQVPRKVDWEIAIEKMAAQSSQFQEETRSNLRNTGASIKNLEVQMSQIAQQLVGSQTPGALPSATVTNPREHNNVSAVTTRSGKVKEVPEKDDDQEDQLLEVELEIKENEVVSEEVTVPKLVVKEKGMKILVKKKD